MSEKDYKILINDMEFEKIAKVEKRLFEDWKENNKAKLNKLYSVLESNKISYEIYSKEVLTRERIFVNPDRLDYEKSINVQIDVYLYLYHIDKICNIKLHSANKSVGLREIPSWLPEALREAIIPFFIAPTPIITELPTKTNTKINDQMIILYNEFINNRRKELDMISLSLGKKGKFSLEPALNNNNKLIKIEEGKYEIAFSLVMKLTIETKHSKCDFVFTAENCDKYLKDSYPFQPEYSDELKKAIRMISEKEYYNAKFSEIISIQTLREEI